MVFQTINHRKAKHQTTALSAMTMPLLLIDRSACLLTFDIDKQIFSDRRALERTRSPLDQRVFFVGFGFGFQFPVFVLGLIRNGATR